MTVAFFTSLAATGFVVAFLHTALPTHWLPFVIVGTGQRWSHRKTLLIAGLAALGHIVLTIAIGLLIMSASFGLQNQFGALFPTLVAAVLLGLGALYIVRWRLKSAHPHHQPLPTFANDRAAIASLVALLALSPCEAFLPIYAANIDKGWLGFAALSLILAMASIMGMLLFTGLSLAGARRFDLTRLARHESLVLGLALGGLGILVLLFDH